MNRLFLIVASLSVVLAATGCTTVRTTTVTHRPVQTVRAEGLTLGDLLVMLGAKRPQAEIVAEVRTKGLRSTPSQSDLDVLAANGAEPELMGIVAQAAAQQPVATEDAGSSMAVAHHDVYWWPSVGLGYYWGYPYGYSPYRYYHGPRAHSYSRGPLLRPPSVIVRPPGVFRPPSVTPGNPFRGPVIRPPGRRR